MRERAAELGRVLTMELGRPLAGAITEIRRSADLLDVYAEEGLRLHAEMPLTGASGEKVIVTREPVGVVVAIAPFNYPVTLLCFKLGAALITGCTVVAKPAEDTPLSTLMLAALFHEAGFPAGCFNVVTGRGRGIGMAMVEHPIPRKVAFTGGTAAGKTIAAAAAGTMKRLTLELGGQSPAIVCDDADLDKA
ncbi:aldehyde dehydrogenase, partial [Rhizobiaceae sp. 2RAB30]